MPVYRLRSVGPLRRHRLSFSPVSVSMRVFLPGQRRHKRESGALLKFTLPRDQCRWRCFESRGDLASIGLLL